MATLSIGGILPSVCVSPEDAKDFLICDGSAYSRVTYSALFEVIGTQYGEGDGMTTFNVPDLPIYSSDIKRSTCVIKHRKFNSRMCDTCGVWIFQGEALWTRDGMHQTDINGKVEIASSDVMIQIHASRAGYVICRLLKDRLAAGKLTSRAMQGVFSRPNIVPMLCDESFASTASQTCIDILLKLDPFALAENRVKKQSIRYSDVNRGFILHFLDTECKNVFEKQGISAVRDIYEHVARATCNDACNAHSVNVLVTLPNQPSIGWHTDHTIALWDSTRPAECPIPEHVSVLYLRLPSSGSPTEICTKDGVEQYDLHVGDLLIFDGSLIHRVQPFRSTDKTDIRVSFVVEHYNLPKTVLNSVATKTYFEKPAL